MIKSIEYLKKNKTLRYACLINILDEKKSPKFKWKNMDKEEIIQLKKKK